MIKNIYRTQKTRQPADYLNPAKPFIVAGDEVSRNDLIFEFMLNATRLQQPISNTLLTERTGLPLEALVPGLQQAQAKGLITQNATHWQITPFGRRYTNDLQGLFLI